MFHIESLGFPNKKQPCVVKLTSSLDSLTSQSNILYKKYMCHFFNSIIKTWEGKENLKHVK